MKNIKTVVLNNCPLSSLQNLEANEIFYFIQQSKKLDQDQFLDIVIYRWL